MARTAVPPVELEVAGRTVRISSPTKIYFADRGLTKLDVVQYFLSVGDGIMRALKDRPTTLERWRDGYFEGAKLSTRADNNGDAFYSRKGAERCARLRPDPSRSLSRADGRRRRCARPNWLLSPGRPTSAPCAFTLGR